ncbi:hypothetical protein BJ508DRAFT_331359 [Ascobolus immersus RN42]|uniref:Uncharacterized protein n=1 Tax=Ascobolus immersus RN42 TaxID=1160509 RepID=A0A3N4HT51_ASCIM|nr:hypothetical protein BJ508DRAFT_331359 [Ascobolus immersus RN42]
MSDGTSDVEMRSGSASGSEEPLPAGPQYMKPSEQYTVEELGLPSFGKLLGSHISGAKGKSPAWMEFSDIQTETTFIAELEGLSGDEIGEKLKDLKDLTLLSLLVLKYPNTFQKDPDVWEAVTNLAAGLGDIERRAYRSMLERTSIPFELEKKLQNLTVGLAFEEFAWDFNEAVGEVIGRLALQIPAHGMQDNPPLFCSKFNTEGNPVTTHPDGTKFKAAPRPGTFVAINDESIRQIVPQLIIDKLVEKRPHVRIWVELLGKLQSFHDAAYQKYEVSPEETDRQSGCCSFGLYFDAVGDTNIVLCKNRTNNFTLMAAVENVWRAGDVVAGANKDHHKDTCWVVRLQQICEEVGLSWTPDTEYGVTSPDQKGVNRFTIGKQYVPTKLEHFRNSN